MGIGKLFHVAIVTFLGGVVGRISALAYYNEKYLSKNTNGEGDFPECTTQNHVPFIYCPEKREDEAAIKQKLTGGQAANAVSINTVTIIGGLGGLALGAFTGCSNDKHTNAQPKRKKRKVQTVKVSPAEDTAFFAEESISSYKKPHYSCPLTGEIMKYPVRASDGINYEKAAIMELIQDELSVGVVPTSPCPPYEELHKMSQHHWVRFEKQLQNEIQGYLKLEDTLKKNRQKQAALIENTDFKRPHASPGHR